MKTGILFGLHGKSGMTSSAESQNARTGILSANTMVFTNGNDSILAQLVPKMAGGYYFGGEPPNYSAGICSKKECKENIKNRYYALRRIKICKKLLKLLPEGNPLLFRHRNGQSQILDGQIVIPVDGMGKSKNGWSRYEYRITENTQPIELRHVYMIRKWKEGHQGHQPPRFKSLYNNQFVAIYSQHSLDRWHGIMQRAEFGELSAVFCKKCSKKLIRELKAAKKSSEQKTLDLEKENTHEDKSIKQLIHELMENAPSDEEAIHTVEEEQPNVIESQDDESAPYGQEMIQEVEISAALNSIEAKKMKQSSLIEEKDRKPSAADIIQSNAAPIVQNINITNIHNTISDSVVSGDIRAEVGNNESN